MPCRWKTQGFSSGEDCISKMTGKVDDPKAFCYGPAEAMQKEWDECIAENKNKADPERHCAEALGIPIIHTGFEKESVTATTILPDGSAFVVADIETKRHPDFDRIWRQFRTHVKPEGEARQRYVDWVAALSLDETKPYGQSMREQFRWVKKHVDFQLWKEDSRAKFWRVDAGYPLESMNQNVYLEDELYRSARTLKHTTVNLNHKFNLPTIDIVAAEYEDGVVEAVLRVPKSLRCPVCNHGKTVNDLIESGGIVNVSLEAICEYNSKTIGACEGMEFTGLALLTKDVLPGIPLTRMLPLEQIMVEALQVSTNKRKRKMTKKKTIVMEVLEQEPEKDEHGCEKGKQTWDPESETCVKLPESDQFEQVPTVDITPVIQKPSMEPDAEGQCEPGYRINALGKCVPTEECPVDSHWDANANEGQGGCVGDTVPKPEHPETSHGLPAAPHEDVLTDAPTEQPVAGEQPPITGTAPIPPPPPSGEPAPEAPAILPAPVTPETEPAPEPHTCPDNYHYVPGAVPPCVPDEPLPPSDMGVTSAEQRLELSQSKFNELKAKGQLETVQQQVAFWENQFNTVNVERLKLRGQVETLNKRTSKLEDLRDKAIRDFNNMQVERDNQRRKWEREVAERETWKERAENYKEKYDVVCRKYNNSLSTNLQLSKKLTQAHEDYLEKATLVEQLQGKLNKAKSISKKIIRIKAP